MYWNLQSWECINWNHHILSKTCENPCSASPGTHRYNCAHALVCCPASHQLQRVTLLSERLSSGGVWHVPSMVTLGQRSMQCHIHRSSSLFGWLLNVIEADPLLYGKTTMYLRIGHNCFPVAVLKQGYDNPCRIHYANLWWLILTREYAHHISHKIEKCNGLLKNSKVGNWYICLWTKY